MCSERQPQQNRLQNSGAVSSDDRTSNFSAGAQQWRIEGSGAEVDAASREALRLEIARLENATAHLESSNVQLEEALADDPTDSDFREAIGENIAVISKYRARVEALRRELEAAGGHDTEPASPADVAALTAAAPPCMSAGPSAEAMGISAAADESPEQILRGGSPTDMQH